MKPVKHPGIRGFIQGFQYAGAGILHAVRTQGNFRFHLWVALGVMLTGSLLHLSRWDWAIITLTIGSVLTAEIINTAAETLVDLTSPEYHPLAKQVKDLAAGGVLITAIVAVFVGILILGPPLLHHLLTLIPF
ncbi:MAG: diacylglycerol kinase family protein [Anaerolineae bacterium]|nr:diacylglycerol kinase family protein [Anaerolineae bacterium]